MHVRLHVQFSNKGKSGINALLYKCSQRAGPLSLPAQMSGMQLPPGVVSVPGMEYQDVLIIQDGDAGVAGTNQGTCRPQHIGPWSRFSPRAERMIGNRMRDGVGFVGPGSA